MTPMRLVHTKIELPKKGARRRDPISSSDREAAPHSNTIKGSKKL